MQDRYSTIGLISTYLHPCSKGTELRELITWLKQQKTDHPLYISGDFNQADSAFSNLWSDLLIYAKVTDIQPNLSTFEGPNGHSALDRILCPTEYLAAAQIDVLMLHIGAIILVDITNSQPPSWSVHVLRAI